MAKIFVGNFSYSVDDEKLREYFSSVGAVTSAKVMREGHGGRSRGFGFVEFSTEDEARKAITDLDGSVWEGRVVKVSEDRTQRRPHSQMSGEGGEQSNGEGMEGDEGVISRPAPVGYFRAQPLDLGFRKKRKLDPFLEDKSLVVDYKDAKLLSRFMSERGRILSRRMTGLTAYHQRLITRAIKRAQHLALLPIVKQQ